jgi:hypothetical protein
MSLPMHCSRTKISRWGRRTPDIAYPRGRWPVFVGLGTPGTVRYAKDNRRIRGRYYSKTLWAVAPGYPGPATITGHEIAGPSVLLFNASGPLRRQVRRLRFERVPDYVGEDWRFGPSSTLIRSPGCYAFEIRGPGFVEYVTFLARP